MSSDINVRIFMFVAIMPNLLQQAHHAIRPGDAGTDIQAGSTRHVLCCTSTLFPYGCARVTNAGVYIRVPALLLHHLSIPHFLAQTHILYHARLL